MTVFKFLLHDLFMSLIDQSQSTKSIGQKNVGPTNHFRFILWFIHAEILFAKKVAMVLVRGIVTTEDQFTKNLSKDLRHHFRRPDITVDPITTMDIQVRWSFWCLWMLLFAINFASKILRVGLTNLKLVEITYTL